MKRAENKNAMKKYAAGALVFTLVVILVANAANLFMQWLIDVVLSVENNLLSSELQFLGTLIIVDVVLVIGFIILYRKRSQELTKLSGGIARIAKGDFDVRIEYRDRESMAHVYRDFNKMSSELSSVQILRNDFINNFSHEFKTPIASINGFASLLLEKDLPEDQKREYLSIIKEESERLSNLTSNTLLLTRLTASSIISGKSTYDLGEQIRQCSIILSQEWLKKGQSFNGEIGQVYYEGNYDLMQHVWINIIGNAVKYTPDGGEISVVLKNNGDRIVVSVTDTGKGMDEQTIRHLFEPYYQADSSHANQGIGLGLSIAKKIVDMCDGDITVKSTVNEGSEFIVSLPYQAA